MEMRPLVLLTYVLLCAVSSEGWELEHSIPELCPYKVVGISKQNLHIYRDQA
jgi:hypothetical protein